MTTLKWEEGKTYRIKPDMVDRYTGLFEICKDIYYQLGDEPFTVQSIDREGRVIKLVEISNDILNIDYWFYANEIKYFDLAEHTEEKQEMKSTKTEQEIVAEWFNKYIYVVENDPTVNTRLYVSSHSRQLILETDLTDIIGEDIYTFIVSRYNLLHTEEETKRKQELLDKRAELELQLAEINKELEE